MMENEEKIQQNDMPEEASSVEQNKLAVRPVGKLLFSLAMPAIAAQIVNLLYNMVDRIYIGHIPGVGALALTGFMLGGWAFSMIRGAKTDNIFMNMRNLILIFAGLSVAKPVINLIYGEDLFARGCETIKVSVDEMNKLLAMRQDTLDGNGGLYENLRIYDSNVSDVPLHEIPFSFISL